MWLYPHVGTLQLDVKSIKYKHTMWNLILSAAVSGVIALTAFVGLQSTPSVQVIQVEPEFGATIPIAGATYNLSGGGLSSTATSLTLSSFTLKQTGQAIQDADMGDTFYLTLEPGNNSRQEIVSCTTVAQNSGGTATLSGCTRGLSPISPYTASTTLRFSHPGGAQMIFSDPPQLFNLYTTKANDEVITGAWEFETLPTSSVVCTGTTHFCNKQYIDALSIQGAATSSETNMGIAQIATQSQWSAGTASSTEGRPLLIPSKAATTTFNNATLAANRIPITNGSGVLSAQFIATTSNDVYKFGGSIFLNAAASIAASSGNLLTLNSLAYLFPPANNATSSILANNGSGTLSWVKQSVRTIAQGVNLGGSTATATTTIATAVIPANTIDAAATRLEVESVYSTTAGSNDCWFQVDFGNGVATTSLAFMEVEPSSSGLINSTIIATSTNGFLAVSRVAADRYDSLAGLKSRYSKFVPVILPTTQTYLAFRTLYVAGGSATTCSVSDYSVKLITI
jgi:hypothetical protein